MTVKCSGLWSLMWIQLSRFSGFNNLPIFVFFSLQGHWMPMCELEAWLWMDNVEEHWLLVNGLNALQFSCLTAHQSSHVNYHSMGWAKITSIPLVFWWLCHCHASDLLPCKHSCCGFVRSSISRRAFHLVDSKPNLQFSALNAECDSTSSQRSCVLWTIWSLHIFEDDFDEWYMFHVFNLWPVFSLHQMILFCSSCFADSARQTAGTLETESCI